MHAAGAAAASACPRASLRCVRAGASPGAADATASSELTFYTNKLCPFAQRVAITLHAKGVTHKTLAIDLRNKPAWYTALVPGGKVPALQLPGEAAPRVESLALMRLLEERFPEPQLLPPTLHAEAEALFALCDAEWVRGGYSVLSQAAPPEQLAAQFVAVAAPVEAALAKHEGPFLLGASFSLADIAYAPFTERYALAFRELRGWDMLAAHPALAAWHAAVEAQPAFRASQAPREQLLELYRMFLKTEYFHRAGVTTPEAQAAAAAAREAAEQTAKQEEKEQSESGRRSLLGALPLLFLPVRGCSVAGATDTHVPPGVACTQLWQPAGGAEARAVARLREGGEAQHPAVSDAPRKP
jgi:glutathione S-transferase